MTTYKINTGGGEYSTTLASQAARVAVAWRRNGLSPSAYAVVDMGAGVSVRRAELHGTIEATRRSLVAAGR